jgi:hypothetical protein
MLKEKQNFILFIFKKHLMKLLLVAICLLMNFTGCKKEEDGPPADTAAVITITAPAANSRYANTSTLQIRGSIDDADILKNAKVELRNKTTGAVLFSQTNATGNIPLYNFSWNWTVSGVSALFTAIVKIISTDQYDYQSIKEVDIILEP